MGDFINKFEESDSVKNSDYTVYDILDPSTGITTTYKLKYSNFSKVLTAEIYNDGINQLKPVQDSIITFASNISNLLDKRGLSYDSNEKVTGSLYIKSGDLSSYNPSHFGSYLDLHNSKIGNVSALSFDDYDLVNKKYVDGIYNSISIPDMSLFVLRSGDKMTGYLNITASSFSTNDLVNKKYVDDSFGTQSGYLSTQNGVMVGYLNVLNPTSASYIASKDYVDSKLNLLNSYLPTSGGSLTNSLNVVNAPNNSSIYDKSVVNRGYVNLKVLTNMLDPNKNSSMAGILVLNYDLISALPNWAITKKYVDDRFGDYTNLVVLTGNNQLTGDLITTPLSSNSSLSAVANADYVGKTFYFQDYVLKSGSTTTNPKLLSTTYKALSNDVLIQSDYNLNLDKGNNFFINLYDKITGFTTNDLNPNLAYKINLYVTDYTTYDDIITDKKQIPFLITPTNASITYSKMFSDKNNDLYYYYSYFTTNIKTSNAFFKVYKVGNDNNAYEYCTLSPTICATKTDKYGKNECVDRSLGLSGGDYEYFSTISCITINKDNEIIYGDNGLSIAKRKTDGTTETICGKANYTRSLIDKGALVGPYCSLYTPITGDIIGDKNSARFKKIVDIVTDSNNNIYVIDKTDKVKKIDTTGNVSILAGQSTSGDLDEVGTNAKFNNLGILEIDDSDNLYVLDIGNKKIKKIQQNGTVKTIYSNTDNSNVVAFKPYSDDSLYIIKNKNYKKFSNSNLLVQYIDGNKNVIKEFYIKSYSDKVFPSKIFIKNNIFYPLTNYFNSYITNGIQYPATATPVFEYYAGAPSYSVYRKTIKELEGYSLSGSNYSDIIEWKINGKSIKLDNSRKLKPFKTFFKKEFIDYGGEGYETGGKIYNQIHTNKYTLIKNGDDWYGYEMV